MALSTILIWAFCAVTTPADNWQCRNDLEIRCNPEHCEAASEGNFTPMRVHVDDAGSMRVCAYSGCWEGTGTVVKSEDFVVLIGHELTFSTSPDSVKLQENIVIAIDRTDDVGILKVGAFAHPLRCERGAPD